MKTKLRVQESCLKVVLVIIALVISSWGRSYGANTINLTLQNCSSGSKTLDFDLVLNNTSGFADTLSFVQIGIDFNYAAVANSGTVSLSYIQGSSDLNLNQNAFDTTNSFLDTSSHQLRFTSQIVLKPRDGSALPAGVNKLVGTFRLTNTNSWSGNSSPDFVFYTGTSNGSKTQTKAAVYNNGSPAITTPSLNLSVTCSVILNPCTPPPAPTGTVSQSFCSNESHTVADLSATGTAINWYSSSSDMNPLAGSTTLINDNHYFATQTVTGCESTSRFEVIVTINNAPPAPTISASADSLISSPDVSYISWQWLLNGGNINGATTANIKVIQNGNYTVVVTDANGCTSTSAPYSYTTVETNTLVAEPSFSISPNPATSQLTLHIPSNLSIETATISIFDVLGKTSSTAVLKGKGKDATIDINKLPAGIYFLQIKTGSGAVVKKFIKE